MRNQVADYHRTTDEADMWRTCRCLQLREGLRPRVLVDSDL
jgi:hypothetical protein